MEDVTPPTPEEASQFDENMLKAGSKYYDFDECDETEKLLWKNASFSSKLVRQWAHPICTAGLRTVPIIIHVPDVEDVQDESISDPHIKDPKKFTTIRQTGAKGVEAMT